MPWPARHPALAEAKGRRPGIAASRLAPARPHPSSRSSARTTKTSWRTTVPVRTAAGAGQDATCRSGPANAEAGGVGVNWWLAPLRLYGTLALAPRRGNAHFRQAPFRSRSVDIERGDVADGRDPATQSGVQRSRPDPRPARARPRQHLAGPGVVRRAGGRDRIAPAVRGPGRARRAVPPLAGDRHPAGLDRGRCGPGPAGRQAVAQRLRRDWLGRPAATGRRQAAPVFLPPVRARPPDPVARAADRRRHPPARRGLRPGPGHPGRHLPALAGAPREPLVAVPRRGVYSPMMLRGAGWRRRGRCTGYGRTV